MVTLITENIPEEMKKLPQWVVWRLETRRDKNGSEKITKVPYQTNGIKAAVDNPNTWTTFERAVKAVNSTQGKFTGIGFVFTKEAGILGIDFDNVRENGVWNQKVLNEIKSFGSYWEISQSGTGAHVYIYAKMSEEQLEGRITGRKKGIRETYYQKRFFVVTGDVVEEGLKINQAQEAFDLWFKDHFPSSQIKKGKVDAKTTTKEGKKSKTEPMFSPAMSDDEVINLCRSAKNSEKFIKLFVNGDTSDYNSASDADLGLCNILTFYTQDPEQVDRLFRKSKLMRDKWNRVGEMTISKAINSKTTFYTGKNKKNEKQDKPLKVEIPFNIVAEHILKNNHIFSMRDNGEIYVYANGVYRAEGTEAILGTMARDLHKELYKQMWNEVNPTFEIGNIPPATIKYVNEVLAYIRAYTHIGREEIDSEQMRYANFTNGLLDLKEWKIIEHTPDIRIIGQFPVAYDEKATCPNIMKYLKSCELTEENINVLTEFAGYCLTPDVKMQKALMLYGSGSNGKSVFINLLKTIIGKDYTSGETLQQLETDKYRVANLYGKRLNAFPDLKDTPLQQNEVFNTLTGNELYLTGERKYQHPFDFKPTAKLMFSANKIPFAFSDNYAYYRRWILIKFPHTFEKSEVDEDLLSKLTTEQEKSGFLNMMIEGLKRLYTNRKFSYTQDVDEVEQEYLLHSDNVAVFEETCLRDCSGNEEPTEKRKVYEAYVKWCAANKLVAQKIKVFTKKLDKAGRKVHNTTKYDETTKKAKWFSCYFNTIVDLDMNPKQKILKTT